MTLRMKILLLCSGFALALATGCGDEDPGRGSAQPESVAASRCLPVPERVSSALAEFDWTSRLDLQDKRDAAGPGAWAATPLDRRYVVVDGGKPIALMLVSTRWPDAVETYAVGQRWFEGGRSQWAAEVLASSDSVTIGEILDAEPTAVERAEACLREAE